MTYSIVARDPESGQLGVAVQTFNLAVGMWVPWAEGGVGAVATQARTERSYGTLGLDLIRGGKTAGEALSALLSIDDKREFRQVSIIDYRENIATHTGKHCFPEAGSVVGDTFCTQANMMARNTVWGAMADAYRTSGGDLADRLLAALDAAEAEGGDMRGKQTAALLVVGPEHGSLPLIDLRVDHHPEPLAELHRLLPLHRAYMLERQVATHVDAGDPDAAYAALNKIEEWAPNEPYLQYLRALHLAGRLGHWDDALAILHTLFQRDPTWRAYLEREAMVDNFGCDGLGRRLLDALDGAIKR
ncbi:MAG: DUF1028 domain-containing protein [Chloroflexota bacterium]|nr:DUF1028 domain-containing protein [Chloroflexota bacterium]